MTIAYRVIARLDVKGANLIKGVQMEGLRKLGDPAAFARRYAQDGADEIAYFDTVASLYGRDNLCAILERTATDVFIPITAGGGVRTINDIRRLLASGADKVALNTAAIREPTIIRRAADTVGSQAIVVSIEAKRVNGGWEAYTDGGRCRTGRDARRWAEESARLGAGEILLTSVDRDGTAKGADVQLAKEIAVGIPVVLGGGIGTPQQALEAAGAADAIAVGAALHYGKTSIPAIKRAMQERGYVVR